jgi:hypothetical protein
MARYKNLLKWAKRNMGLAPERQVIEANSPPQNTPPRRTASPPQNRLSAGWEAMQRNELLTSVQSVSHKSTRSAVSRHFFQLSNYEAAVETYRGFSFKKMPLWDQVLWIRACLRSHRGFDAKWMLPRVLPYNLSIAGLGVREVRAIIDLVYEAPLDEDLKISTFDRWYREGGLAAQSMAHLEFQKFRLEFARGKDLDVIHHMRPQDITVNDPDGRLRYLSYAKLVGKQAEVEPVIRSLLRSSEGQSHKVLEAVLNFSPELIVEELDLNQLSGDFISSPRGIGRLSGYRALFSDLIERGVAEMMANYPAATIQQKGAALAQLVALDRLDLANDMIEAHLPPDTVLPAVNAVALRAFELGDFHTARESFLQVLRQNPSDNTAAAGLRFCLPRTGGTIADIVKVRDEIGYGVTGAGLPGRRANIGNEFTVSLLFSGDYVRGLASKGLARHWQSVKIALGDRFLNYELLPDGRGKSLFVIADDGVSDEVRTAQFYAGLVGMFDRITISCDPRLLGLLQRSFPAIEFIPSFRNRKGLDDRIGRLGERSGIMNGVLSKFLTVEAESGLESADYVTFGQCLFFNHFMGRLPRSVGRYLVPAAPLKRLPRRKIGLIWRSHLVSGWRKAMYLGIEEFEPLLVADADFVAIQHMLTPQEEAFCVQKGIEVPKHIDLYDDFEAIADLTAGLDLVIGLSTLPIELAAAVGTPVWMLGYSPENYFLRTKNGASEEDRLTANSTVIAPEWIDFSQPKSNCVRAVMNEALRRLL